MKKNLFDNLQVVQSLSSLDEIKSKVKLIEKKNNAIFALVAGLATLTLLAVLAVILFKKNSYDYDLFDDEYFEDDFDDDFEDFEDEDLFEE